MLLLLYNHYQYIPLPLWQLPVPLQLPWHVILILTDIDLYVVLLYITMHITTTYYYRYCAIGPIYSVIAIVMLVVLDIIIIAILAVTVIVT